MLSYHVLHPFYSPFPRSTLLLLFLFLSSFHILHLLFDLFLDFKKEMMDENKVIMESKRMKEINGVRLDMGWNGMCDMRLQYGMLLCASVSCFISCQRTIE